jgi:hypothetical protein
VDDYRGVDMTDGNALDQSESITVTLAVSEWVRVAAAITRTYGAGDPALERIREAVAGGANAPDRANPDVVGDRRAVGLNVARAWARWELGHGSWADQIAAIIDDPEGGVDKLNAARSRYSDLGVFSIADFDGSREGRE